MLRARSFATIWLVGLLAASTQAAEFKSPQGFTIEYPDDWRVAGKEQAEAIPGEAKEALAKLGNVDFDRVAVMIFSPEADDFTEAVNVVALPGRNPELDEAARKEFVATLTGQFKKAGWTLKGDIDSKLIKIGGQTAISVTYEVQYPSFQEPVKQWQAVVRGSKGLLFVTCWAKAADFARYLPTFEKIVGSLKIDTEGR